MAFSPELLGYIVDNLASEGYSIVPDAMPAYEVAALAADCRQGWQAGRFHAAAVGRGDAQQVVTDIRADHVCWVNEQQATPPQMAYLIQMEELRQALNAGLYLGLFELETHFALYPPGAFYKRHVDNFRGTGQRLVTTILYLNGNWQTGDGGELRIYPDEQDDSRYIDVEPRAGTLVTFLAADFFHEVLPAYKPRMSLTGWFRKRTGA